MRRPSLDSGQCSPRPWCWHFQTHPRQGLGAVLSQEGEHSEQVIVFFSRALRVELLCHSLRVAGCHPGDLQLQSLALWEVVSPAH